MNQQAWAHNRAIPNVYGPEMFIVTHEDGKATRWYANNKKHLELLLRLETNLGWCPKVTHIEAVTDEQLILEF
ncbi:MAG TPA: hypothetical protein PKE39_04410 [Ignavibacteria bacterium]|nr:hypothetical protein [Ignavibacteria bacterium]HMQ98245.1 hypothetical protein [Ignavibacteria bacterium]